MVNSGTKNVLYINNKPVTMLERYQFVPTALVPNIAASMVDDNVDETTTAGSMTWPYKPILLVATKQAQAEYVAPLIETHFAIEVTFKGLR